MNKKIELIEKDGSHIKISNGNIFYKDPEDNAFHCVVEPNDVSRPLHVKEASNIIKLHNIKGIFEKLDYTKFDIDTIDSDTVQRMEQELNKIKLNNTMEFSFYDSSLKSIDLSNSTKTVDLVRVDSDIYTNTIDLNNLIECIGVPGTSSFIDLNIQYSNIDGKVFNKSTFLEGFKYDDNGKLVGDNIIQDLGDVELTYVDGIITVIAKTLNIIECIINKCTITYGKL